MNPDNSRKTTKEQLTPSQQGKKSRSARRSAKAKQKLVTLDDNSSSDNGYASLTTNNKKPRLDESPNNTTTLLASQEKPYPTDTPTTLNDSILPPGTNLLDPGTNLNSTHLSEEIEGNAKSDSTVDYEQSQASFQDLVRVKEEKEDFEEFLQRLAFVDLNTQHWKDDDDCDNLHDLHDSNDGHPDNFKAYDPTSKFYRPPSDKIVLPPRLLVQTPNPACPGYHFNTYFWIQPSRNYATDDIGIRQPFDDEFDISQFFTHDSFTGLQSNDDLTFEYKNAPMTFISENRISQTLYQRFYGIDLLSEYYTTEAFVEELKHLRYTWKVKTGKVKPWWHSIINPEKLGKKRGDKKKKEVSSNVEQPPADISNSHAITSSTLSKSGKKRLKRQQIAKAESDGHIVSDP